MVIGEFELSDFQMLKVERKQDDFGCERIELRIWYRFNTAYEWRRTRKGIFILASDFKERLFPILRKLEQSIEL